MTADTMPQAELNGRTIYVIGPQRFLNRLLTFYIEANTGATCLEGRDYKVYDSSQHDVHQSLLFLVDCSGKNNSTFLDDLTPLKQIARDRHYVATFNVDPELGEEGRALDQGVRGFFYEEDSLEQLIKGISVIFLNELWVSREILTQHVLNGGRKVESTKNTTGLTPREHEILTLIAAGAKNESIAEKLCISPNTVRTHIYNIFKKINVPNRLQAALWAVQNL